MPLQTGQVLNQRYRIVKLLGQGGFGAVYRAWDSNLNKPCAVKENLDTSPEAQRQFTREATVLANLSHPNLPRVTDHFILPGQGQYLVMDFVEGDDLASILRQRGPVPSEQAVAWVSQVADALAYLHSRQPPVVHRDIKPANIRITPEGQAMLVDFGLVKVYSPQLRTTMGARAVTPGYAPPEQYGQGNTDARSDIYALGATLYNILTGHEPVESVQRMSGAQLKPMQQINPRINPAISQAVERSMRLEPTQRYQTVSEFKAALTASTPPVVVRPMQENYVKPAMKPPAPQAVVAAPGRPLTPATGQKVRQKTGLWVGVLAVVALCLVGSLAAIGLIVASDNQSAKQTSDAQLRATMAERVRSTSTNQARQTATARIEATQNALFGNLEAKKTLVYGPASGALEHSAGTLVIAQDAGVNLKNFIIEAQFYNPYSATESPYDYGFILRHEAKNNHYRFVVRSDKTWRLINHVEDPNGIILAQGELPEMDTSEKGSNVVKLIFQGERGWFFFNGKQAAVLDLSARVNSGAIFIATGMFQANRREGASTNYTGFTIWSIP